jgi:hypothetical protein
MSKLPNSGLRLNQTDQGTFPYVLHSCLRMPLLYLAFVIAIVLGSAPLPGANSIRQVDFKNFEYPLGRPGFPKSYWHWIPNIPPIKVKLSDGNHPFPSESPYQIPALQMISVTYGKLAGDNEDQAAVVLNYSTGGTANWEYLYIYKLEKGAPRLLAWLESGSRAAGGLVEVKIENGLLVLDFADAKRSLGECCSEGYIRVRYVWKNGQFVESGPRERGDLKLDIAPAQ